MDILNFISWIRGGRYFTSVNPATTLLPIGLKDNRRDDGYLAGTMTVESLINQVKTYKVYTALLTQSSNDDASSTISNVNLTIGVTYRIIDFGGAEGYDFTNVGAPNNNENTYFVATGTTPNSWGTNVALGYVPAAPVVTVLENTIGNVWFTYEGVGGYKVQSNSLFTANKSTFNILNIENTDLTVSMLWMNFLGITENDAFLQTFTFNVDGGWNGGDYINGSLQNTPIEIRVYN
jgi:hypothetical protein